MTNSKLDSYIAFISILITGLLLFFVAINSVVHYEGSESLNHYYIAEGVFQKPLLLLDHWGKPLFTLLASPFTYFGTRGVMIFNCIIMLLSAWVAFKFLKKLGVQFAFPVIILILFAPVYYSFSQSCLTEPLFGLVAITSAYFFLQKRYLLATILISFIIFSRSEGMMFIPIYGIVLILKKRYKILPFLVFGLVFYSLIGFFLGKSILWYYYEYPYNSVVSFYGKGPFWHWFTNQEYITGTPFSILLVVSFFLLVLRFFLKIRESFTHANLVIYFLVLLPALIYVFGHSFLWYKGWSASVGLYRIVGGVITLLAVISVIGLVKILKLIPPFFYRKWIKLFLLLIFCGWVIQFTFKEKDSLVLQQPNDITKLIHESIDWLEGSELEYDNLYVYKTEYQEHFGVNPYTTENSFLKNNITKRANPELELKSGDIVIWDGQVTPNEGGIPIEVFDTNQYFVPIKEFRPKQEFKVLGGGNYYIKIFQRK